MSYNDHRVIKIGSKLFEDVTNETVAGETFSYQEAIIYGRTGERVYCSN